MVNALLTFLQTPAPTVKPSIEEALGAGDELAYLLVLLLIIGVSVGIWAITKKTGRRKPDA